MAKKKAPQVALDPKRRISALESQLKQLRGERLTRQQERDIAWLEHLESVRHVQQWQQAVPKKDYCKLASRQHKLVDDAACNYDLPLDDDVIDLGAALTALHDFIAANAHRLRGPDLDGFELREEKMRREIRLLAQEEERRDIELQFRRGDAIPRDQLREALNQLSAQLRTLGQTLERIKPDARDALNQFLDTVAAEIESGTLHF